MPDTVLRILPTIFFSFFFFLFLPTVLKFTMSTTLNDIIHDLQMREPKAQSVRQCCSSSSFQLIKTGYKPVCDFHSITVLWSCTLAVFYLCPFLSTSFYVLSISSCYHVSFPTSMAEANCIYEAHTGDSSKMWWWLKVINIYPLSVQF